MKQTKEKTMTDEDIVKVIKALLSYYNIMDDMCSPYFQDWSSMTNEDYDIKEMLDNVKRELQNDHLHKS
jgi:hypothetical protein